MSGKLDSNEGGFEVSAPVAPARDPASTLFTALCLSFVAGFLDGFTYTGHGGAFASAMTGNVLLLAIRLPTAPRLALDNLWPIVAFVIGVFVANLIKRAVGKRFTPLWSPMTAVAAEIVILVTLTFFGGGLSDGALVAALAVATAMQNTIFRTIGGNSYNSIIMTGNLQNVADSLASGIAPYRPDALRRSGHLAAICGTFFVGALGGAVATPRLHQGTPLVAVAILVVVAAFLAMPRRAVNAPPPRP